MKSGCDYYETETIVIQFINETNNENEKNIYLGSKRGYYPDYEGTALDSDCEFNSDVYLQKLKVNKKNKILYENGSFLKFDYEVKFKKILEENGVNIDDVKCLFKKYDYQKRSKKIKII